MKRLLFILSLLFVLISCKGQNNFFWSHSSVKNELLLTFDDIANVPVADASSVSNWNTFFDLPTYGTAFTGVNVVGNVVNLRGGSGITVKNGLFVNNTHIINITDTLGCIIAAGTDSFNSCTGLVNPSFPALTAAGINCFAYCTGLVNPYFPSLITVGTACFYHCTGLVNPNSLSLTSVGSFCFELCTSLTAFNFHICTALGATVGLDYVFYGITGKTITLTVPTALMTCDGGDPDGDIRYLQANNTVTIIQI